jgi:hypothetical protein
MWTEAGKQNDFCVRWYVSIAQRLYSVYAEKMSAFKSASTIVWDTDGKTNSDGSDNSSEAYFKLKYGIIYFITICAIPVYQPLHMLLYI